MFKHVINISSMALVQNYTGHVSGLEIHWDMEKLESHQCKTLGMDLINDEKKLAKMTICICVLILK